MRAGFKLLEKEDLTLEELLFNLGPLYSEQPLSKEEFVMLAERFPKIRMERERNGKITVMSPVKKGTSIREAKLGGLLFMWNFQNNLGECFSPNGGFDLPDGSTRLPDAAWISKEKMANSQPEEEEDFVKIVPDFVAAIRSGSDRLAKLKKKMKDTWMKNGVRLSWLIDPYKEKVWVYRAGEVEPELIEGFAKKKLSGENVLPGFELDLELFRIQK